MFAVLAMPPAARAGEWRLLPDTFHETWKQLSTGYPGVKIKFQWGRAHAIYGRPLCGGETWADAAETFLADYAGLFGLSRSELTAVRTSVPQPGKGPIYVFYEQHHTDQRFGDVPLDGAGLSLTIANRPGYPVTFVSSTLHPTPTAKLRDVRISSEQAERIIDDLFDVPPNHRNGITSVIMPIGKAPEFAWQLDVEPYGREGEPERIIVSAYDGRVRKRRDLYHRFGDFTLTVKGERSTDEHYPPHCSLVTVKTYAMPWVFAELDETGGGIEHQEGFTDENGQITFTSVPSDYDITATLENDWFILHDESADPYTESAGFMDTDTDGTFSFFNTGSRPYTLQQVNTWKWLNFTRQTVEDLDDTFLDGSAQVDVLCNFIGCGGQYFPAAGGNPPKIRLTRLNPDPPACDSGEWCQCDCDAEGIILRGGFHTSTSVAHEYTHHLVTIQGPSNPSGAWREGVCDTFATFMTAQSVITPKLCNCADDVMFTRYLDPVTEKLWPSLVVLGDHAHGVLIGQAYWDMRKDIDNDRAATIVLHSIKKHPSGIDPTVALHAVQIDDDSSIFSDGNDDLDDGSPNYEEINAAFRLHDLATDNIEYVELAWTGAAPSDPAVSATQVISIDVVDTGDYDLVGTDPVKMRYRINTGGGAGGAWTTLVMAPGILDDWIATLPGSSQFGDVIDFYIRVEAEEGEKTFFTCFPLQAQFDFSTGVEERDFFSVVVTEQAKTVALSTDLESDPSWTSSTEDPDAQEVWKHSAPEFTPFGEQPAFDYPYDFDGAGFGVGPYCFWTFGYTDGDDEKVPSVGANETWTLTTATFDLSDSDLDGAVVSYALWFYVRGGLEDDDKFIVEFFNGSSWATIQTIAVGGDGTALQRWIRQRVTIPSFSPGSGRQLRFSAIRHSSSGGIVEAAVDEVRVWGVHED